MYESKILRLKEVAVFSLADISQIVSGKDYAKKLVKKLIKKKEILKIKQNAYTFYDDPLLISTFLVKPSYISSVSALSYYKLITQIPKEIFCFTNKKQKKIKFGCEINFIKTIYFLGFENKEYRGFKIPIATPEKAIIDSLGIVPISIFEEAIEGVDIDRMLEYLKKIKKSSIIKRISYLLEKNGFDIHEHVKRFINYRYIYLDPLAKKTGKKNKKWRIIDNIK